jgi:formyltetrahydrofolate deformylase
MPIPGGGRVLAKACSVAGTSATSATRKVGILQVFGPDCNGIVAGCTQLLNRHNCGILKSEQWTDRQNSLFFSRIAFHYETNPNPPTPPPPSATPALIHPGATTTTTPTTISTTPCPSTTDSPTVTTTPMTVDDMKLSCQSQLDDLCQSMQLQSRLNWRDRRPSVGILVSKYDHCLWELLLRHSAQELDMDIQCVISNHDDLRAVAETFSIPFHHTPISSETKIEQEQVQLQLLQNVDVVVLARYMQVLSSNFLNHFPHRILNIHHSFLPAFMGSKPYHRAHDRGVKLIGATAHYATLDLDEGPIIEQDVIPVSHRDEVKDLLRKGRIVERSVLLRALEAHLDDRVIVHKNRCVVFGD